MIWKMKHDCHELMAMMWGIDKKGRTKAYMWLKSNTGVAHFGGVNDYETLYLARKELEKRAIRKGFIQFPSIEA